MGDQTQADQHRLSMHCMRATKDQSRAILTDLKQMQNITLGAEVLRAIEREREYATCQTLRTDMWGIVMEFSDVIFSPVNGVISALALQS